MRLASQILLTFVLNAVWQIALVTALAAIGSWLLRMTNCRYRHAIWVAALLLSVTLPAFSSLKSHAGGFFNRIEPQGAIAPYSHNLSELKVEESRAVRATAIDDHSVFPRHLPYRIALFLSVVYALFVSFNAFKLVRAWRRTLAIVKSAHPVDLFADQRAIVKRCQRAAGVTRGQLLVSGAVPLPITAGVFKPVIILPARLLAEADEDVFATAVGHEWFHVARRDYLLNFLYELIYLAISFHPGARVVRRHIKETREICCDDLVATTLLKPEIYARSLVRLIGSVPTIRQLPASTTIGITEANILEVRIMSLLQSSQSSRRPHLLLSIAVLVLLLTPCLAAAAFALDFDVARDLEGTVVQDGSQRRNELGKAQEELKRKERQLEKLIQNQKVKPEQVEQIQRLEREVREAADKVQEHELNQQRQVQERLSEIQKNLELHERLVQDAHLKELHERMSQLVTVYPFGNQENLEAVKRLSKEAERLSREEQKTEEDRQRELSELWIDPARHAAGGEREGPGRGEAPDEVIRGRARIDESVDQSRRELAKAATVSMDKAIQLAMSSHPGKVVACNLERHEDGQPSYRVVIITDNGNMTRRVWVSAVDGRILKTEQK